MEGFVWAAILNAENYTALTVPLMKSGASALSSTALRISKASERPRRATASRG